MSDQVIFDIGMHQGEDTAYYLVRGYRVVGVEADPELFARCRARFQDAIAAGRLFLHHGAIVEDDRAETVRFFKNTRNSVWGTTVRAWAERNAGLGAASVEIEVPAVDFAKLIADHGCPYYLKIDIEGMDRVCLAKLRGTPLRPKFVSIESEKVNYCDLVKEFDLFQELGYRRFFIQQQADIARRKVPQESAEGRYVDYVFEEGSTGPFGSDLGPDWLTRKQALSHYRAIFTEYALFGDGARLPKFGRGKAFIDFLARKLRRPVPGWYDTHARYG